MIIPHESLAMNEEKCQEMEESNGNIFQETHCSGSKNLRGSVKIYPYWCPCLGLASVLGLKGLVAPFIYLFVPSP